LTSFTYIGTLYHPMKPAKQFAVIDNEGSAVHDDFSWFLRWLLGAVRAPAGEAAGQF
jgi:hypothetical protein